MKSESIYKLIQREWKLFLTLFLAGILFYIYPIANQAITLDNDGHIVKQTFNWYLESRRWGILLFQKLFFLRTFVPGFWIVVNMSLVALATVIISDLFKFRQDWLKYLFGLLVISFPQYCHMMKFACTADAIGLGFVMVAWGFHLYSRSNTWKANLGILLLFIGALSIYVAVIFIPMTLFLILSVIHLSNGDLSIKKWISGSVRLASITALAYAIYYSIALGTLEYYHLPKALPGYFDMMIRWGKDPLSDIICRTPGLIWSHWIGKAYIGEKVFVLVWIPFVVMLWHVIKQKIALKAKILSVVLLVATMVAPFIMIVLLGGRKEPPTVLFPQGYLYATLFCLMFQRLPKIKPEWVMTGVAILFIHNGYRVTQFFHYDKIVETAERNLATRIISRLDSMGIDVEDHRIIIVGRYEINPIYPNNKWTFRQGSSTLDSNLCAAKPRQTNFLQIHGFTRVKLEYPSREQIKKLEPTIAEMPTWPALGSVALVDNIVVIKLSQNYDLEKNYPNGWLPKK